MSFLDDLLAREERVLHEARRHPIFMVVKSAPYLLGAIFLWIAATLAIVYIPDLAGVRVGLILGLVLIAGSLVPLVVGAYRILFWWREVYIITSYRIIQIEGLMNRRTFDSALEKVNDVVTTQSIFGRMFNYGTVDIVTAADAAINDIAGVSKPFVFKRILMQAKVDYGSRGLDDDGFPTRRSTAVPAASSGADTDQLPSFEDEHQQSRAVIALTELRNSGVLSDAEFNEKLRRLTGSK
ncbi:PH domain-containing protein [soil metagenome]